MVDICFIILNYNLYEETMACVQSIKNHIDTDSYSIIIVDNASPNAAGEKLKEYFAVDDIVEVIFLPNNVGFAKGNNVGIKRALEIGAKYVCCINDDAELISDNLYSEVNNKYLEYQAAIIGPQVVNTFGAVDGFTHPLRRITDYEKTLSLWSTESYRQYKKRKGLTFKYKLRKFIDHFNLSRKLFRIIKKKMTGIDPYVEHSPVYISDTSDVIMTGCCLVFTPLFFAHLSGFNESTFLYWEEEFLMVDLLCKGLHTLYVPDIVVLHKGGVSTENATGNKAMKKWAFMRKHFTDSLRMFIAYLKDHEEELYKNENGS